MNMQPVLVLLHGHGVDAAIWDDLYADLSADYTIIRPDLSKLTTHASIEAYAEHLSGLLQTAQVDGCVLVGHSMGGYIALAFAEQHPDQMAGLCLFHSTALADDDAKREQRRKTIQKLRENGGKAFIEEIILKMMGETFRQQHPDRVEQLVERYRQLPDEALTVGMQAIAARPDRTDILKNADFPVLFIAGRKDELIPFEKLEPQFSLSPRIRSVVLDEAGHLGMIESPDEAIVAMREFMKEIQSGAA